MIYKKVQVKVAHFIQFWKAPWKYKWFLKVKITKHILTFLKKTMAQSPKDVSENPENKEEQTVT